MLLKQVGLDSGRIVGGTARYFDAAQQLICTLQADLPVLRGRGESFARSLPVAASWLHGGFFAANQKISLPDNQSE